jgi:hypothetical protein
VTGLSGTGLVLQVNGGDDRAINMNGTFTFPTAVPEGTHYSVSVATSPTNPSQTCTITNGSGVVAAAPVTNVAVACRTDSFRIGGTVNGLDGTGLVLQNNGADDVTIASNGSFTFTQELASGASYHVTVRTQPVNKSQTCTIANATGTVGSGDVRNVRVTCATNTYQIRGTVTGLVGHGFILRNNGDDIGIDADGGFTFAREVASGGNYNVTVQRQPNDPTQACTVANGSGTVTSADITNVTVTCVTSQFSIGGTVSGLQGNATPLVLRNNGAEDVTVQSDGVFTFPTPLLSGTTYNVTVAAQPTGPLEVCNVANGVGTVGGSNITNITVSCLRIGFAVGGVVSGLAGRNLVIQNNGGDELMIAADGPFTLPNTLTEGSSYNITVRTQPDTPTQQCVVANGVGIVGTSDISSISISCTTSSFRIGGRVSGLKEGEGDGGQLILQNNGGDTLQIFDDGPFTFATPVLSGASYSVSIPFGGQPMNRNCTVENASGTVTDRDIGDTHVHCEHDRGGGGV